VAIRARPYESEANLRRMQASMRIWPYRADLDCVLEAHTHMVELRKER
jgi:hypothetical protein